ncbi:MAG TPA: ParA family protein [Gemmataceae bacterium]|nr:ParA family protein [Gemmataceae bacterium]
MAKAPYILGIVSHKGGTGRTTTALCLAWHLGQAGRKVTLIDADPMRCMSLLALNAAGSCPWPNVEFRAGGEALAESHQTDLVIVDSPSLLDPLSQQVLDAADGIILTSLADPLSIRTVPAAAAIIGKARERNPRLELLGLLAGIYNARDEVQRAVLGRLQDGHRELLLSPVIPFQSEMREWAMKAGVQPPEGAASAAFATLSRNLVDSLLARKSG